MAHGPRQRGGRAGTEEDSPNGRMAWGSSGGYPNLPWLLGGRVKQSNSDGVWRVHVWRVRWSLEGRVFFFVIAENNDGVSYEVASADALFVQCRIHWSRELLVDASLLTV